MALKNATLTHQRGRVYFHGEQGAEFLAQQKLKTTTKTVQNAAQNIEHAADRFAFGNSNVATYGAISKHLTLSRDYPTVDVKGRVVEVTFEAAVDKNFAGSAETTRNAAEQLTIDWLKKEFATKTDRNPGGFGAPVEVFVKVKLPEE